MAARKPTRRHEPDPPPLSAKEIRFAQLCAESGRVYRSYLDAGLPPGPDERSTRMRASRLVRNRYIWAYVLHLRRVADAAARVSVEELAAIVANFATADRRKLFDRQGRLLPPHRWPDDVAATVESVEMADPPKPAAKGKGKKARPSRAAAPVKKVKTVSRLAAAAKLMDWKGMTAGPKAPGPDPAGDLLRDAIRDDLARRPGGPGAAPGQPGPAGEGGPAPAVADAPPPVPD